MCGGAFQKARHHLRVVFDLWIFLKMDLKMKMHLKSLLVLMSLITLAACTVPTVPVTSINDTFLGSYHIVDRRNTYRDYSAYDRLVLSRHDQVLALAYYLPNTATPAKIVRLYRCVQNTPRDQSNQFEELLSCDYDGQVMRNSSIGFSKIHGPYVSKGGEMLASIINRNNAMPVNDGYLLSYYGALMRFSLAKD